MIDIEVPKDQFFWVALRFLDIEEPKGQVFCGFYRLLIFDS
jgi:hypothetical protein